MKSKVVIRINFFGSSSFSFLVSFRPSHHQRISAQSGSTAYGSMRSDSMNVESALFLPSNHSSMVCIFFMLNSSRISLSKRFPWLNIRVHHHMNTILYPLKISGRIFIDHFFEISFFSIIDMNRVIITMH
jgi:hypothetical protein